MDLIKRTQAALDGITEGPWEARHRTDFDWLSKSPLVESSDHQPGSTVRAAGATDPTWGSLWPNRNANRDAEFIAAARTLVPELLAALIEARREVNDLSGAQADADELFQKVQDLEAKVRRLEGDS